MRAAYLSGPGDIVIKRMKRPKPQNDWVVVKVESAGICGSDLHFWRGEINLPNPLIPGHEFAGELYEVESSTDTEIFDKYGLKIGDKVAVEPLIECGQCEFCSKGLYNLCPDLKFIGYQYQGGFAQYALVPARKLFKIPENMDLDQAALLDCLSVAVHAVNLLPDKAISSLAVIGDGMIGLSTTLVAKAMLDPKKILILGKHDHNLTLGLNLGADAVINISNGGKIEREYSSWDSIFEAVGGSSSAFEDALNLVKPGGSIISLGIHSQKISIPMGALVIKHVNLWGSNGYSTSKGKRDFQEALNLLKEKLNMKYLITHVLPLDEITTGFRMMENKDESKAIKVVIKPNI